MTEFDDGRVGVYLHLPFCERICPYCDFAVVAAPTLPPEREARYADAILRELAARKGDFPGRELATVYFGGGTPALFRPETLERLIRAVAEAFPGQNAVETTLELNPSTVELERLPGFRAAGIDRLSIGIQSFDDVQLKRLGRAHRAPVARETLRAARAAGFDNLSVDLIFAGPAQSLADLDRDLDEVIKWSPEHVSTYELTFEPETPFGQALARGQLAACDEDLAAEMIERIESRLSAADFERYEISSYAKPGRRATHNARYWQRQAVLGLGMGAHSTEARCAEHPHGARRANARSLEAWLSQMDFDAAGAGEIEALSAETARGEAVFLGLRQREGLGAAGFAAEFGGPPRAFFDAEIEQALAAGWLLEESAQAEEQGGKQGRALDLRLSSEGRLVADSVAALFVSGGHDGSAAG
ncbi:MAG: radical SAM family heme chaperone HemW [Myxococcota bacterium]